MRSNHSNTSSICSSSSSSRGSRGSRGSNSGSNSRSPCSNNNVSESCTNDYDRNDSREFRRDIIRSSVTKVGSINSNSDDGDNSAVRTCSMQSVRNNNETVFIPKGGHDDHTTTIQSNEGSIIHNILQDNETKDNKKDCSETDSHDLVTTDIPPSSQTDGGVKGKDTSCNNCNDSNINFANNRQQEQQLKQKPEQLEQATKIEQQKQQPQQLRNATQVDTEGGEDDIHVDCEDFDYDDTHPSLFQYSRLYGSLPRRSYNNYDMTPPLDSPCTCSVMGKVVVTPDTTNIRSEEKFPITSHGGTTSSSSSSNNVVPTNFSPTITLTSASAGFSSNSSTNDNNKKLSNDKKSTSPQVEGAVGDGNGIVRPKLTPSVAVGSSLSSSHSPASMTNAHITTSLLSMEDLDANRASEQELQQQQQEQYEHQQQTSLWLNEIIPIAGLGLRDGHVLLIDAKTGTSALANNSIDKPYFRVRDHSNQTIPIAAVSLDSSGTSFGAIDEGGMCCVWSIKYCIQMRKVRTRRSTNTTTAENNSVINTALSTDTTNTTATMTAEASVLSSQRQSMSPSSQLQSHISSARVVDTNSPLTSTGATSNQLQAPIPIVSGIGTVFSNFVSAMQWQTASAPPPPLPATASTNPNSTGANLQQKFGVTTRTSTTTTTTSTTIQRSNNFNKNNENTTNNSTSADTQHLGLSEESASGITRDYSTRNSTNHNSNYCVVPALTVAESKMHRINYPKSFGKPTCLALDPSYSHKRETSLLVGFADGRIVLSKRGWLLQRREDRFLQYTGPAADRDFRGIEAVVWRGTIIAFADCSGVRLYDSETFKPIAHIDRPTGARPSLYRHFATLVPVQPSLCFETSHSLLVAWGDCLLQVKIRETTATAGKMTSNNNNNSNSSSNLADDVLALQQGNSNTNTSNTNHVEGVEASQQQPSTNTVSNNSNSTNNRNKSVQHQRKRVVECSMAWALDCVACGVSPLDENHVVVLGMASTNDDDDDENDNEVKYDDGYYLTENQKKTNCELELQIISRWSGNVVSSDVLPLVSYPPPTCSPSPLGQSQTKPEKSALSIELKAANSNRLVQATHPPTSQYSSASLVKSSSNTSTKKNDQFFAINQYFLLSSFAVPRMENSLELAEELKITASTTEAVAALTNENVIDYGQMGSDLDPAVRGLNPSVVTTGTTGTNTHVSTSFDHYNQRKRRMVFRDSHLQWSIHMATFDVDGKPKVIDDNNDYRRITVREALPQSQLLQLKNTCSEGDTNQSLNIGDDDDSSSVDSDDYGFVLRPIRSPQSAEASGESMRGLSSFQASRPPILVIVSNADAIVARTRDIDDMIAFTLEQRKKPATALRLGIQYIRSLQRHTIEQLVHSYFNGLLRTSVTTTSFLSASPSSDNYSSTFFRTIANTNSNCISMKVIAKKQQQQRHQSSSLSLKRLNLAVEAMPILLGVDTSMWEYWLSKLENIPGALFVVCKHLPVRDPKLPTSIYNKVLARMFEQIDVIQKQQENRTSWTIPLRHSLSSDDGDVVTAPSTEGSDTGAVKSIVTIQAENHFLNTLLAWGTTDILNEHIKLFEHQAKVYPTTTAFYTALAQEASSYYKRRYEQSARSYLIFPRSNLGPTSDTRQSPPCNSTTGLTQNSDNECYDTSDQMEPKDALYDVDQLMTFITSKMSTTKRLKTNHPDGTNTNQNVEESCFENNGQIHSRVALDAMAKLCVMTGRNDVALRYYLEIGARQSSLSLPQLEESAVAAVNDSNMNNTTTSSTIDVKMDVVGNGQEDLCTKSMFNYSYILRFIEQHHLHQYLLDQRLLSDSCRTTPMIALLRLIGLDLVGKFLIDHCVPPQQQFARPVPSLPSAHKVFDDATTTTGERRGTLPLDLVAEQFSGTPKLLYWYLHLVFTHKPDVYAKFPNTANPPKIIIQFHKKQLDLYIKYAGPNRNSVTALQGLDSYLVLEKSTPLLSFLKVTLQLGSISPVEVGKLLQKERRGGAGTSHTFALELAYIVEHYGDNSESDARLILELYLHGAQSLMLAVSFTQRTKLYSMELWETLISHCLRSSIQSETAKTGLLTETATAAAAMSGSETLSTFDGKLFGSMLEAAALCGADLALLVEQIPAGMRVDNLKPRLVAAVADYRLKVEMHKRAAAIAMRERVALLREFTQRARRGMRYENTSSIRTSNNSRSHVMATTLNGWQYQTSAITSHDHPSTRDDLRVPSKPFVRTIERRDPQVLSSFSLPIR